MTYTALYDPALTYFSKFIQKNAIIFFHLLYSFASEFMWIFFMIFISVKFLILFMYCFPTLLKCLCCIL